MGARRNHGLKAYRHARGASRRIVTVRVIDQNSPDRCCCCRRTRERTTNDEFQRRANKLARAHRTYLGAAGAVVRWPDPVDDDACCPRNLQCPHDMPIERRAIKNLAPYQITFR